ncbi:Major Facilitator Superfamily protein [Geodermatophilus dictyosporus]|uniref:Major Facilitator Superfamily protein n=1 Tax=Geodermatophilus dictyosporus TaxID=1523247 RepID=A0A1I5U8I1_9ACTN|nr:MFS transporter [Geodermatophilus dictyosporus]SFP91564.1 Major Facilitator Superfamily protein [Geodermatophilus dictyosporus]
MTQARPATDSRWTVPALCAVQFVDVLGATVVTAALPAVLADLGAPASAAGAVVTSYAVLFGALLVLGARLGDRFGHGRVLQVGVAAFGAASLVAATAPTVAVLVGARGALGAAAAASVPSALRLLTAAAPDGQPRHRALAAWSATGAAAGASGLVLGGVVTDLAGWRVLFWANVPLAVLLLLAVRRTAPPTPRQRSGSLDVAGAVVLTTAVAAVVTGAALLEGEAARGAGVLAVLAGLAAAGLLPAVERRARDPLLPRAALADPRLRAGALASAANTATTSSAVTLATLHLQQAAGFGPTGAGLALLPFSLCVVLGAGLAARLLRRTSQRATAALGLAAIAVGDAALLAVGLGAWVVPGAVAVAGLGIGLSSVAATSLGTAVAPALQGTAAGVLNTAAQLGTALGVAVVLLVAAASTGSALPLTGAPLGWLVAAAAAVAAAIALRRGDRACDDAGSA